MIKEYCIGCGACISSCPSPNAIKLVRDEDDETNEGVTYPIITKSACIRCGFCAEVCPTEPKTLECGENHLLKPEFNLIPSKDNLSLMIIFVSDVKKCMKQCPVNAIFMLKMTVRLL